MSSYKTKFSYIIFFLFCAAISAQDSNRETKLSFHSFSITPEVFFMQYAYSAGFAITADLSYSSKEIIYMFSASVGEEISIWYEGDSFQQLNLLIGKQFHVSGKFFIDTHVGAGVIFQNSNYYSQRVHSTNVGIPIVVKPRFKIGDKFSLGLKLQANINSETNIYSTGILLQFNY